MTPPPFRRLFLAAALLVPGFGFVRADTGATAPAPAGTGTAPAAPIPFAQLPQRLQQEFSEARQHFSSEPRYADIVDHAWKNFQPQIQSLPSGSYPSDKVEKVSRAVEHWVQSDKEYQEASRMQDPAERQRKLAQSQSNREQGDADFHSFAVASGVSPSVDPMTNVVTPEDVNKMMGQIRDATITAAQTEPHGGSVPGLPPIGAFMGGTPSPGSPASLLNGARDDIFKGDSSGALALADAAVTAGGGADAYAVRAAVQYDRGQYGKAYGDAQKSLELDASNEQATAVLHFAQERVDGTASSGGSGAAAGSGGARSASSAARAATSNGLTASAAAAGQAVGALAAREADQALAIGDFAAARASVEKGLAADPANSALLARRAQLEARAGEWGKSLSDAVAALKTDPRNMALLRAEALAQLRTKDYAGAIATANEMLELDPNSADALALRGQAYGLLGKKDLMTADLESAARIDPFYKEIARKAAAGELVAPADSDVLFLMPGEGTNAAGAASTPGRGRRLGMMLGVAAAGGLLLALGLLSSLKDKTAAALTRLTRTGPTVGAIDDEGESAPPASSTLIRGQYELTREIAAGGMGRVYEGTDRSLGRRVAIKKMRDELRADPRERARFVAEAKTVAALHHPNIVDIYAIAEDASDVFLVFEYVDGKTVHELVYARGRLEPAAAAGIVRASAEALQFAHSRGVIHRDMKLSNVMVDASGAVKVMDFGIARVAKDALTRSTMTQRVIGTPPYMAPEQESGAVRPESDVYALAVCAYEMLAGELPFAGVGAGMTLNKTNMAYTPPSRRGLPLAFDAVFSAAFQPDPVRRVRTPREFAAAFEAAAGAGARA